MKNTLIKLSAFLVTLTPLIAFLAFYSIARAESISDMLIVCDGGVGQPCDFNAFMKLLNNVIKLLLTKVAFLMFMAGGFYIGWMFLNSGGKIDVRKKARSMAVNLVVGYVIALSSWVIIKTVIVIFAGERPSFDTFF